METKKVSRRAFITRAAKALAGMLIMPQVTSVYEQRKHYMLPEKIYDDINHYLENTYKNSRIKKEGLARHAELDDDFKWYTIFNKKGAETAILIKDHHPLSTDLTFTSGMYGPICDISLKYADFLGIEFPEYQKLLDMLVQEQYIYNITWHGNSLSKEEIKKEMKNEWRTKRHSRKTLYEKYGKRIVGLEDYDLLSKHKYLSALNDVIDQILLDYPSLYDKVDTFNELSREGNFPVRLNEGDNINEILQAGQTLHKIGDELAVQRSEEAIGAFMEAMDKRRSYCGSILYGAGHIDEMKDILESHDMSTIELTYPLVEDLIRLE